MQYIILLLFFGPMKIGEAQNRCLLSLRNEDIHLHSSIYIGIHCVLVLPSLGSGGYNVGQLKSKR